MTRPAITTEDIRSDRLAERARAAMAPAAYDYCAGGAGDQASIARNVAALDAMTLTPRMLTGPLAPDGLRVEVPGGVLAGPLLVAPMGLQGLCCADAEVASATAAAALGLGHCLSMFASRTIEDVAGAGPGLRWQQLYLLRERQLTERMAARAEVAGCVALVLTVDVPVLGRRTLDTHNGFRRFHAAPPALVRDGTLGPRFGFGAGVDAEAALAAQFPDDRTTWSDVRWLTRRTALPVLVKGVLDPRDARRALDAGAAGVIVSNHGGRQFDRCVAAIDALAPVVAALDPHVPVLFDSGVRGGTHAAVALALGARAVLVGRPVLWGLATGGEPGARAVLATLLDDLRQVLRVVGAPTVAALRELTVHRDHPAAPVSTGPPVPAQSVAVSHAR